jgi:superfamily I DNA/RNA helicase
VQPYKDRVYQSKEKDLPHIVGFKSDAEQIQMLVELFKNTDMSNVGILLPDNNMVVELYERLLANKVHVECKYSLDRDLTINTLNFNTPKPKLMTYHSAKGLQFKRVILPLCLPVSGEDNQKALYVAMTRTQKELTIMYTGDFPPAPLDKVPEYLYIKTL